MSNTTGRVAGTELVIDGGITAMLRDLRFVEKREDIVGL